jgi:hypothetical protein
VRNANSDLPILDELGLEFEQLVAGGPAAAPSPSAPPRPASPKAAPRRRGAGRGSRRTARVTRRAAVVLVLLCLIGGVAAAARFAGGGGSAPEHTAPALLGRSGGTANVSAYRDRSQLCLLLAARGASLTSDCGQAPGAEAVRATSLRAGGKRLVAGLAGPRVTAVAISVGDDNARTATHSAADPGAAAKAGVPAGSRWFVVSLPGGNAPALVIPLDRDGHELSAGYLDCSLGVVGAACEARIRAAASAVERSR